MRVGLIGYGRAGSAVTKVLEREPDLELRWIARRGSNAFPPQTRTPVLATRDQSFESILDQMPVDAVVDFSGPDGVFQYGEAVRRRGVSVVSAISAYEPAALDYLRELGQSCRVLSSPNITLGINFLMLAARMLRSIAPFADVEIVEEHFREKPEVSGTARKLAQQLNVSDHQVTSLRIGGIVGHHEVIFGFPHQTVRIVHDSIDRQAFGTGAAFALRELAKLPKGFYSYDELMMRLVREQLGALSTA